ncbi:hypothetical protein BSZ40_00305 [Buchananella hordeovulneris]|uniref:Uncharacterized protein n=1 Tax=Buchananella hordeovulneris TaxID=52770 RepID=A0A1Q5PYA7_9ACTO|nr:hypothetical protein BSZ40_00305 [Buchananella hordeovulneris]
MVGVETLEFSRESAGVSAKCDWHDSRSFAFAGRVLESWNTDGCALNLPRGTNDGVRAWKQALKSMRELLSDVTFEFSDACALYGSGLESAIGNHDATEQLINDQARIIAEEMGAVCVAR